MKKRGSRAVCALLAVLLLLSACGAAAPETATGFALDTVVSVTVWGGEEGAAGRVLELCGRYEAVFSRTLPDSEISRINRGEDPALSEDAEALLVLSLDWAARTGGAFDPALGAVTSLWDFHSEDPDLPDPDDVAAALARSGYGRVALAGDRCSLSDGAQLDLGGVAKGYIADRIGEAIAAEGAAGAVVNLGGDVLCLGHKPDGSGFTVGIQKPFADAGEVLLSVTVSDMAVVTSGVYERYFTRDGRTYHHVLDPETGYPAESGLVSVTVLTPSAADGDALATACLVLGPQAGMALIDGLENAWAVFLTDSGEILFSEGLRERFSVRD